MALDQRHQGLTAPGGEPFAVGQPGSRQRREGLGRQLHRCRKHRTKQTTPTHLVNANAGGGIEPAKGIIGMKLSRRLMNGAGGGGVRRHHRLQALVLEWVVTWAPAPGRGWLWGRDWAP